MNINQIKNTDKYRDMLKMSIIKGNNFRIKKAINKARSNEKVTILYLGGSITKLDVNKVEDCYAEVSYQYFNEYFGHKENVVYVNSGMAGTDSILGLMRLEMEVIPYHPDVVFVEYAVNDAKDSLHREVFESLIISLLELENKPAVIPIFMASDSGYSCQGHMQVISEYYSLPMISVKDGITWGIKNNIMEWTDYSYDNIHPNQCGHYLAAEFIAYYYREVDKEIEDEEFQIPQKPFHVNTYLNLKLIDSRNFKANTVGSFRTAAYSYGFHYGWKHSSYAENESFTMKLKCKNMFVVYKESSALTEGNAQVYIDGSLKGTLNGYRMFSWDNPTAKLIFSEEEYKEHTIEIKMADGDEEKEFTLLAFGFSTDQIQGKENSMGTQKKGIELSPLISDGMVLQRNSEVKLWGKAIPGKKLILSFLDTKYQTKVDKQGKWEIIIDGLSAGGPYEMQINCEEEQLTVHNILVGDIWVLGGQSNMQIPVKRTLDLFEDEVKNAKCPYIRQFIVPQEYDFHGPKDEITGGSWFAVTPGTVYDFSAVGYFYAKKLYEKYQVPIGLILTAIGGTPIEAWMSEKTLMRFGRFQEELYLCKDDSYIQNTKQKEEARNNQWYRYVYERDEGLHDKTAQWFTSDCNDNDWRSMEVPVNFKGTELEFLKGSVWFRKEIDVPKEMLLGKGKIALGTIIDADETYINGIKVGNTGYMYPPRRYEIPEGVLKEGKNLIAVRVMIYENVGAFITDMPYYIKANGVELPLSGTWKYRIGCILNPLPPTTFFQYKPTGVFNGMIYPIRNYSMKGVLWYQGESNAGYPYDYKNLMEALIRDWRALWSMGDFPFLYVQLPKHCFWKMEPKESGLAYLRDQQRQVLNTVNTGMAVALDVGEYNDLHPQDKKTVGERLALCAMKIVYGEDIVYSGPLYHSMKKEGNKIKLYFNHVGSGLVSKDGELKTFEICGNDNKFVKAKAVIDKEIICVSSDLVEEPIAVRYAWADNPEDANLYNREGLPASPFTTQS